MSSSDVTWTCSRGCSRTRRPTRARWSAAWPRSRPPTAAILPARFDDNFHVIVLRGHGDKFFSAGANIAYLNSITPRYKYFFCLHANETLNRLEHTPKLTIAALNGHTVGGGLE